MMRGKRAQAGFVHSRVMDLVFLFVLILFAIGLVKVFETLISGEYAVAFFVIWLLAAAAAWWWSREQRLFLRVPAGVLVFIVLAVALIPLSWWTQSRLSTGAEAVVAAVLARYLGTRGSRLIEARTAAAAPWYLDQCIDLIADLGRWVFACIIAWFVVGVLPLLLVAIMSPDKVPWAALAWSFAATVWFCLKQRPSRVRFQKIPLGLYAFVAAVLVLKYFQQHVAGPMEGGSFEEIVYVAYWPVVAALFVEIVLVGTRKTVSAGT